jgi:hypothetical protein
MFYHMKIEHRRRNFSFTLIYLIIDRFSCGVVACHFYSFDSKFVILMLVEACNISNINICIFFILKKKKKKKNRRRVPCCTLR